ncbi:hypothetical protein PIROE2DRAFT_60936 [Piromyces sp. E2]|nr:hypothetical protein PIROE2DRAFT_60936 [Piromyces sp. E2]|eukprot:OUM64022.1 hypothetical protein PIROE2DRAFT_60936 [Piromyces sp. E2]
MPNIFHIVINPKSLEYYEDIIKYLTGLKYFQWLKVVEHIGQEEKHYHVVLQLSKSMPKLSVNKLHGAHIRPKIFGSTKKLIDYVDCKDEKHISEGVTAVLIDEIGERRHQGGMCVADLREAEKEDVPAILYNIKNKIDNEYKSTSKFHQMLDEIRMNLLTGIRVIYFIGKPGCGKTYNAYTHAFALGYANEDITKVTINNNFFEFVGSINDKCLIVEEFRPSQLHPSSLLQFTDKYGYSCPIKGGFKYVRPETIIICSIMHPSRLYREEKDELNEQFTRRITHLYEVENDHSYKEIFLNQVYIGGRPIGFRTEFNQLEEYEVTNDWDGTRTVIN